MKALLCPTCGSPNVSKVNPTEYQCENCSTRATLSTDQDYLILFQGYPCPSCGFRNESAVKFCGNCGTKLVKYCCSCGAENQVELKFCTNCGKPEFRHFRLLHVNFWPGKTRYKQIEVVKLIKDKFQLGLSEAKRVSETPCVIATGTNMDNINAFKKDLERSGAVVEIAPESVNLPTISSITGRQVNNSLDS